jgi:hypothetical protein
MEFLHPPSSDQVLGVKALTPMGRVKGVVLKTLTTFGALMSNGLVVARPC